MTEEETAAQAQWAEQLAIARGLIFEAGQAFAGKDYGASLLGLTEALLIMSIYDVKGGIAVSHDEICAGPADEIQVAPADLTRLEELGWDLNVEGGFKRFV